MNCSLTERMTGSVSSSLEANWSAFISPRPNILHIYGSRTARRSPRRHPQGAHGSSQEPPTPPPPRTPPVPPSPHPHLRDEGADLVLDLHQPPQAPFHDGGEVEQPQCVPGGRRVENHHREIHPLHQPGRAGGGRGGVQWGHLWGAGPTARPTLTSSPRRSSWPRRCRGRRSWLPASSSCPCSACCPPQRTRRGVPPLPGWGRSPGGGVVGFRGGLRGEGLLGWGSHGVGVP